MNILKLSKYPPIEGGESAKAYWKSRGLGKKGHKVFLVTNSFEVENEYRTELTAEDLDYYQPKNVKVYNTTPFNNPKFIPSFNPYDIKLISKGIEILEKEDIDIIEGSYLLPFGFAAHYLAKEFNKPLILTHAGSDMTRLISSKLYKSALLRTLKSADKIITFRNGTKLFEKFGINAKKISEISCMVDNKAFNENVKPINIEELTPNKNNPTILTHFGKISRGKGVFELIDAISEIKENYALVFVGNGKEKNNLIDYVKSKGISDKVSFHDFVPPWRVPGIMKASDCLLSVEHGFGVEIHGPIIPIEGMLVGKPCIVSNKINIYHKYKEGEGIIKINADNLKEYTEKIEFVINEKEKIKKIAEKGRKNAEKNNNFDDYIKKTIACYESTLRK